MLHAPGTARSYLLAIDVLGAVLEAACGRPLEAIVRAAVTQALPLERIAFVAPPETILATPYASTAALPERLGDQYVLPMGQSSIVYAPGRAWHADAFPSGATG